MKMKRALLIICLSFLFLNAMSQDVNYIPYYQSVNKAKLAKCQQNYDSALVYYAKAFEMVDYILIEDLHHFSQCAMTAHKDSLVYFAMERCNKQTIPIAYIIPSDSAYQKYSKTEQWKTCMAYETQNWDAYTIYKKDYSSPAKKILDSLYFVGLDVRRKMGTWYCQAFRKSKLAKKRLQELIIVYDSIQRVVDAVIQKYGFPNERIGCPNTYISYYGGWVLFHYDDIDFFRNVEYKALLEGKLSPDSYALKADDRISGIYKWDKQKYTYSKKMTLQEKAQVNKNRYEIGLPSVEEAAIIRQCNNRESQEYQKHKEKAK